MARTAASLGEGEGEQARRALVLRELAQMYQVPRLELLCAQALQESVGPASAVPLLEAAHTTGDGRLLAQCRRYVADHAAEVRASGGVEQLRDLGVAKGLLGDALDQVAELKMGAARTAAGRHYFTCVAQREDPIPRILTFDGPILRKVVGAFKSGSKSEIPSTIARVGAKILRRLPPVAVATLTQWAVKHVMIVALPVVKRLLDEETPVLGNRYTPIGWLYVLSFDTNYVEDYAFDFEHSLALLKSHRKGWLWRLLSQWSAYKERCFLVHSIDTGGGYNSVWNGRAGPSA